MMSCSSLYFCRMRLTSLATAKCSSPTIDASRMREVDVSGSTAGVDTQLRDRRDSSVVASR